MAQTKKKKGWVCYPLSEKQLKALELGRKKRARAAKNATKHKKATSAAMTAKRSIASIKSKRRKNSRKR